MGMTLIPKSFSRARTRACEVLRAPLLSALERPRSPTVWSRTARAWACKYKQRASQQLNAHTIRSTSCVSAHQVVLCCSPLPKHRTRHAATRQRLYN